jgi:hypothetical protein
MSNPYDVLLNNEYAYIEVLGLGHVQIKKESEGIVIDVWNKDQTQLLGTMTVWNEDMVVEDE